MVYVLILGRADIYFIDVEYAPDKREWLRSLLRLKCVKYTFDILDQLKFITLFDVPICNYGKWIDLKVTDWLLNSDASEPSLNQLTRRHEQSLQLSKASDSFSQLCQHSLAIFKLLNSIYLPRLNLENLMSVLDDHEMPFNASLSIVEIHGIRLDTDKFISVWDSFTEELARLEKRAYALAKRRFDISCSKTIKDILLNKLRIQPPPSITLNSRIKELLIALSADHELPKIISEHRRISQVVSSHLIPIMNTIEDTDQGSRVFYKSSIYTVCHDPVFSDFTDFEGNWSR